MLNDRQHCAAQTSRPHTADLSAYGEADHGSTLYFHSKLAGGVAAVSGRFHRREPLVISTALLYDKNMLEI